MNKLLISLFVYAFGMNTVIAQTITETNNATEKSAAGAKGPVGSGIPETVGESATVPKADSAGGSQSGADNAGPDVPGPHSSMPATNQGNSFGSGVPETVGVSEASSSANQKDSGTGSSNNQEGRSSN